MENILNSLNRKLIIKCLEKYTATALLVITLHLFVNNVSAEVTSVSFERQNGFLPKQTNLRKWDSPVVSDLDGDGYPDLILNDHGYSIKVVWNNKGVFSEPQDLLMGDAHGVSIGDFNKDGNKDIVISRGGGSGSNARNSIIYSVTKQRVFSRLKDFAQPLVNMRGRTVKFHDFDQDGDLDLLNFAYPSKEKNGDSENYIYENHKGELVLANTLPRSFQDGQKTLISDIDQDGQFDLLMYGFKDAKIYLGKEQLSFKDATSSVFDLPITDVTGALQLDYDNDGDFDLFLTRGADFPKNTRIYNKQAKRLGFYTKRGPFDILLIGVGDKLSIENLQSQWPNKNIYIGESGYKYEFSGETHSGRDITFLSSDSLGFPQTRDQKGTYIGYVGNGNWRFAGNFFSPHTGVFNGVSSYINNPTESDILNPRKGSTSSLGDTESMPDLLLQNKSGKLFTKAIKNDSISNEKAATQNMAVSSADFNNDGFEDLVIIERGTLLSPIKLDIRLNNGKGQFISAPQNFGASTEIGSIGMAVQTLDFNLDGKVDILIGNERGKWHLFKNKTLTAGKYFSMNIPPSPKFKASPQGAIVALRSCSKTQLRMVGNGGAMYSQNADHYVHFGVGECEKGSISVTWTNGEKSNKTVSF